MDLTIVETTSNTTEHVRVPATVAAGRIITKLTELWGLPHIARDGQHLSYAFERGPAGRPIGEDETLADADVHEHDVLRLVARATPGRARETEATKSLSGATAAEAVAPAAVGPTPSLGHPARRDPRGLPQVGQARPPRLHVYAAASGALAGAGIGVVLATGSLSGSPAARVRPTAAQPIATSPTAQNTTTAAALSEAEMVRARGMVMGLLGSYQADYSTHDVAALSGLLAPEVARHGLAGGGCRVSHGRRAVAASYQAQFEAGSGTYSLVGVAEGQIHLDTINEAHLNAHYRITPGGTGYVNFRFTEAGDGWKISEVYATCK